MVFSHLSIFVWLSDFLLREKLRTLFLQKVVFIGILTVVFLKSPGIRIVPFIVYLQNRFLSNMLMHDSYKYPCLLFPPLRNGLYVWCAFTKARLVTVKNAISHPQAVLVHVYFVSIANYCISK